VPSAVGSQLDPAAVRQYTVTSTLVATMDLYGVLLQFKTVLLVLTVVQFTTAKICYECTDDPDADWFPYYDAECAKYDYRGNANTWNTDGCSIQLHDNGYITRTYTGGYEDGECVYGLDYTRCVCTSDYCNTDYLCEDCTGPTTEDTTVTTSSSTTRAPDTMKCYQCINCGQVDDATPVIEGEYLSCVTTIVLESA
ncbi:unnamed protein product, partial [Meganyctiphanes norvegica]